MRHIVPHPYQLLFFLSRAMASSGSREQFLRQMEQIVEGIKQNRMKVRLAFSSRTWELFQKSLLDNNYKCRNSLCEVQASNLQILSLSHP